MSDESMIDELRRTAELAAIRLGVAFSNWKKESEKPEQDLDIQAVSDAWDLLMFREEEFHKALGDLQLVDPGARVCDGC